MQTREKTKYTMMVLLRDANAIVADSYHPVRPEPFRADVDFDCCVTSILHCITDQVLEKPYQIGFVALHSGQRFDRYGGPA